MVTNFIPRRFDGYNPMPTYVADKRTYTLVGTLKTGYEICLGRLTSGVSASGNNTLYHILFESFDDHGRRMCEVRSRATGPIGPINALVDALAGAGVSVTNVTACTCPTVLNSLGKWFLKHNPELESCAVVSQSCH
ncbi:hypothetical protein [Anaerovibrio sp.]|uniref:hypothetical protein n=1 Tax=Anaerovibrio sp. TaxID=1872532 RepID=UPI003F187FF8